MKTSSSRNRAATQNASSKSSKAPSAKPLTPLQPNQINVNVIGKRSESKKPVPPKPPVKSKFNVEGNMTQSKIFQAKQGLQLLKRKMNRTGMSRQKKQRNNDLPELSMKPFNRANSNQELISKRQTQTKKEEPSAKNAKYQSNIPKPTNKDRSITSQLQVKKMQAQSSKELQDERPIAHTNNFLEILQKEIQKQAKSNSKQSNPPKAFQSKNKIVDDNGEEVILEYCSKGCGRMFNPQILQRHEKVCQKVFQSKRKVFDSFSRRLPEGEVPPIPPSHNKVDQKPQKAKSGVPKWKLDSAALRAGIKIAKNKPLTKEEEIMMQMPQENRTSCQFCGRKFNEEAAKKHIAFCQRKSKQIGNSNNLKKKK